jgi:hypothetical protein
MDIEYSAELGLKVGDKVQVKHINYTVGKILETPTAYHVRLDRPNGEVVILDIDRDTQEATNS